MNLSMEQKDSDSQSQRIDMWHARGWEELEWEFDKHQDSTVQHSKVYSVSSDKP